MVGNNVVKKISEFSSGIFAENARIADSVLSQVGSIYDVIS